MRRRKLANLWIPKKETPLLERTLEERDSFVVKRNRVEGKDLIKKKKKNLIYLIEEKLKEQIKNFKLWKSFCFTYFFLKSNNYLFLSICLSFIYLFFPSLFHFLLLMKEYDNQHEWPVLIVQYRRERDSWVWHEGDGDTVDCFDVRVVYFSTLKFADSGFGKCKSFVFVGNKTGLKNETLESLSWTTIQ